MKNTPTNTNSKTGDVSLNVMGQHASLKSKPHSRMGWRRAAVLIAVHVVIIVHILLWVRTGSTVSPVEPSEAMQTLEYGEVNAGFIFFVAAILATFVFGRFFCGWGCHIVALQDLCTWMMNKVGVRPKPFRSRLLVWAPLVFGLYMFVWPTFKRLALFPLLQSVGVEPPIWLGAVPEFHGFSSGIIVEDFWATFPPWYVAVPFFGVVGFAAVYFLGSKGFCTYGCPYGGIFGVVDQVSPGRIVVNDNCHQCGHCTAVCTSNVRVAEEIKDFGMVVDPGCMKCLDCVSACPNDALSFSMAMPAKFRKPVDDEAKARRAKHKKNPKRYDLSWPEEIALAVVFVAMFFAYRGMLNLIPMLMAAGMAGIGAFAAWKLWSLISKPNVRVQSIVLKSKGKVAATGYAAGLLALAVVLSAAWGGFINYNRMTARFAHEKLDIPIEIVMRPEYVPTQATLTAANKGRDAFARTDTFANGGYGWPLNAEHKREYAYLQLIAGNAGESERLLREISQEGKPTAQLIQQLATLKQNRGASEADVLGLLTEAFNTHEAMDSLAPAIAMRIARAHGGDLKPAFEFWDKQISDDDDDPFTLYQVAEFAVAVNKPGVARRYFERAESAGETTNQSKIIRSRVQAKLGDQQGAIETLRALAENGDIDPFEAATVVSMLTSLGEFEQASTLANQAIALHPESLPLLQADVILAVAVGDLDRARSRSREIVSLAGDSPWKLLSVGESIVRSGLLARNRELAQIGIDSIRQASARIPDSPLVLHDLGQALLATGVIDQGIESLERAAELAPGNSALSQALQTARDRIGR